MKKPTLYLMLGYPGAGKTTAAKIISELTGAVHLWADKIRNERYPNPTHSHAENLELYEYLNALTAEFLASGQSVIFDTGFNFYKDRQLLRSIAAKHHASTCVLWLQTNNSTSRSRATQAGRNSYPNAMSLAQFERLSNCLEPPRPDEHAINLDGTKISRQYVKVTLNL